LLYIYEELSSLEYESSISTTGLNLWCKIKMMNEVDIFKGRSGVLDFIEFIYVFEFEDRD
jgi:hypothetical protein